MMIRHPLENAFFKVHTSIRFETFRTSCLLKFRRSGAEVCKSYTSSRKMLKNTPIPVIGAVGTAENEPLNLQSLVVISIIC